MRDLFKWFVHSWVLRYIYIIYSMKWKFGNKINKRKLKAQWIVITFLINIYLSRMKIRKIIRFDIFLVPVRLENPFNLPSHNRISTPHFTLIMILNAHALIGKIIIHECQESWQDRSPRLSATFFFEDYAKGNGRTIRSYLPSTNKISTESNLGLDKSDRDRRQSSPPISTEKFQKGNFPSLACNQWNSSW